MNFLKGLWIRIKEAYYIYYKHPDSGYVRIVVRGVLFVIILICFGWWAAVTFLVL